MGLHIGDRIWFHAGHFLGPGDHVGLSFDSGRGEAHFACPVVIEGRPTQHGVNRIAVGQRVLDTPQCHHADAVAEQRPLRSGVERPAMAVGRQHAAILRR